MDHSTLNCWVLKYAPELEKQFRCHQCPVGRSWWLDETHVKIKGKWASYIAPSIKRATPLIFY
jgi:putative transposase